MSLNRRSVWPPLLFFLAAFSECRFLATGSAAEPGKHPASPAPNRKRHTTIEAKFHAAPVNAVNVDHITTTFMSTLRGPKRSPIQPPGISNRAYEIVNAENTQPICVSVSFRSLRMSGAACEMHTRSI